MPASNIGFSSASSSAEKRIRTELIAQKRAQVAALEADLEEIRGAQRRHISRHRRLTPRQHAELRRARTANDFRTIWRAAKKRQQYPARRIKSESIPAVRHQRPAACGRRRRSTNRSTAASGSRDGPSGAPPGPEHTFRWNDGTIEPYWLLIRDRVAGGFIVLVQTPERAAEAWTRGSA